MKKTTVTWVNKMKKSNSFIHKLIKSIKRHGKPFYANILLCILFLLASASICLLVSLHALDALGEQARVSTAVALESNMTYLRAMRLQTSLKELAASLDEDGLLMRMSDPKQRSADAIAQMEERLYSIFLSLPGEETVPYLYFQHGDYAMGHELAGADVRGITGGQIFEDFASLPVTSAGYSETRLMKDGEGNQLSVRAESVLDGVLFLYVVYGDPEVEISSDLLAALYEPEMYYYDRFGNVGACQSSKKFMHLYDYNSLGDEQTGSFSFAFDGNVYNCYYEKVLDSDTKFALFTKDNASEAKQTLLTSMFGAVGVMLVLGIVLTVLSARRLYQPMQELVEKFPHDSTGGIRDDYRLLREALETRDMAIAEQHEVLMRIALLRLLQGASPEYYDIGGDAFFFNVQDANFTVAVLRPDEAYDLTDDSKTYIYEEGIKKFFYEYGFTALFVSDGQLMLSVFDLRQKSIDELMVCMGALREKMRSDEGVLLSAFISGVYTKGTASLHCAYMEAMQVAEYCTVLEKYDTLLDFDSIREQMYAGRSNILDYGELQRLSAAVIGLCSDEALARFDAVIFRITARRETSHAAMVLCLPILRSALSLSLHEIYLPCEDLAEEIANGTRHIELAGNFQQLRSALIEIIERLCELNERISSDRGKFEQIKAYVMEQYLEPYFSAGTVAEQFQTSQSNITRLFKKHNRTGFLEFVNMLRVDMAKSLLLTTDYCVHEISQMVGYSNTVTMTRAFKRYAGITPGSFRQKEGGILLGPPRGK